VTTAIRRALEHAEETMSSTREVIETTADKVSAELRRRGVDPDEPVTLILDLGRELVPGRREGRAHVVAGGLSDNDIDRLIRNARRDANEEMRRPE
jgi:hypothetical protein